MRFEVPQFIDIEDKIFGPLTWRQFLYLGGGAGLGVVIFLTSHFLVFLFIGLPLVLFALALAFLPINNRPFSYFLEAIFNYITRQRKYFWGRKDNTVYRNHVAKKSQNSATNAQTGKKDISSMSRRLELEALQQNK